MTLYSGILTSNLRPPWSILILEPRIEVSLEIHFWSSTDGLLFLGKRSHGPTGLESLGPLSNVHLFSYYPSTLHYSRSHLIVLHYTPLELPAIPELEKRQERGNFGQTQDGRPNWKGLHIQVKTKSHPLGRSNRKELSRHAVRTTNPSSLQNQNYWLEVIELDLSIGRDGKSFIRSCSMNLKDSELKKDTFNEFLLWRENPKNSPHPR